MNRFIIPYIILAMGVVLIILNFIIAFATQFDGGFWFRTSVSILIIISMVLRVKQIKAEQ